MLDVPGAADAYRADFAVLALRRDGAGFTLHGPEGAILDHAPQAALAVIAPADADAGVRDALYAWTAAQDLAAPVIPHDPGLAAALRRLAGAATTAALGSTTLRLQLAELRLAHEALQRSHAALAALLQEQGIALPRLGFSHPPDPEGRVAAASDIFQPIPVDVRTLCGIALHLAQPHAAGLVLELLASEDDRGATTWTIPAQHFEAGWVCFAFAPRLLPVAGGAAIRLRWHGDCPPFSLGRPSLRPERAAVIDGQRIDRALALRAFVTAPGAALSVTAAMTPALRLDGAPLTRIEVALDDSLELLDPRGLNRQFHFRPVGVLAERRHILVHPLSAFPTLARLPALCPPGTQEVVVRVETINPAAGPIEYALHLAAPDEGPDDEAAIAALARTLDWTCLPPCTEALLRIELAAGLDRATDLLLLTRLLPDGDSAFCWAHVTGITLFGRFDAG